MCNCLQKIKALFSQKHRKLLASFAVFIMICVNLSAADKTWTGNAGNNDWNTAGNWSPTGVPQTTDTVTLSDNVTITLSDEVYIKNLYIFTGAANTVTLNLNGKNLNINTRLRLGQTDVGNLVLQNGSLTTSEFDTNDDGENSLYLNNTNITVSTMLLTNGEGKTTVDGTGSSSFTIPANYNTSYGTGNTLTFTGAIQPTVASGTYTITSSGVPAPGATITINITSSVDFENITYKATFTGTGETYKVNGSAITNAETTVTNSPAASTMTITVELPPSIEPGHGISFALYEGTSVVDTALLGTPLFYTQQSDTTTWTGNAGDNDWNNISNWNNGIPAKNMNVVIPSGASSYPELTTDISTITLKSVNLNAAGSELTIGAAGKIKTDSLINKGALANSGTITTGDFTNNAAITNSGNIYVTQDLTSTANITGTGNLIFSGTGTTNQIFTAGTYQYSNIQEDKTGSGTLTINGSCEIDSLTITRGTETIFADTPEITTFTNDSTHTGKITFNNGATINGAFTYTTGITQITGPLYADSVVLGTLSLAGTSNAITTTGTQSFSAIDGATALTLDSGTSSISFNGAVGSSTALTTLEVNGAAIIASGCTGITTTTLQTYNSTLTINDTTTIKSNTEIDFANTISGTQKLTVDTPVFKSTYSNDNSITLDEIEFAATSTSIQTNSKELTFNVSSLSGTGKTISLSSSSKVKLAAGITVSPTITNSGTITCDGAATFEGPYSGTGASLTLSNGTTTFKSDLDLSGTTFVHSSGTVEIAGTAADAVTVKGPASPQSFYNFSTSRSLIINGDNSFNNFTASDLGGKTISFEAGKTQTVNGTLELSGTSENKLNLIPEGTGTWNIICANPATLENLSVTNSYNNNSTTGGVVFTTTGSIDNGGNTNWAFPGQHYTWTGADTTNPTKWDESENWNPKSLPGKGSIVEIQAGLADGHYPVLTDSIDIDNGDAATENGTITNNGQLDLVSYNIKAKKIINNGTIKLYGTASQTITKSDGTTATMENGASSIVEYHGTGSIENFVWDGGTENGIQYSNLTISKPVPDSSSASSQQLVVSSTAKIKAGSGNTVTLSSLTQGSTGTVILGDSTTSTSAGIVTLTSSGTLTIANNATADSLTCNCKVKIQNVTTSGTQNYNDDTEVSSAAAIESTGGNITFATGKQLSVNAATSITVPASNFINFNGPITGTAKLTTAGAGAAKFTGVVSSLAELETQAVQINCTSISTTGNQTYNGTTEIGVNTELSAPVNQLIQFNGAITGTSYKLTTSGAAVAEFKNSVNIGNLETQAAKISTTSTITAAGTQVYNGALELAANTTLSAGNSVTFNANVTGSKSLEVSGPVYVNCEQITTTDTTQTYNGTVNLGVNSQFTASQINFNSNITDGVVTGSRKKLTIASPVLKSIIASGSASINLGELSFAASNTAPVSGNTSIQTENGTTIAFNVSLLSGNGKTITLATNPLAANNSSFTFTGDVEVNPNLITSDGTSLTASTGVMTFKADLDLTNGSFDANNGTIKLTAANKGANPAILNGGGKTFNNLTITGAANINGDNTINGTLLLTGTNPVSILGNNTIATFTASGLGSKTISFKSGTNQTVTDMTLTGDSTNKLILTRTTTSTGTWNISCTHEPVLEYLTVSDSTNNTPGTPVPGTNFVAFNSDDAGNNRHWNFPQMIYKWTVGQNSTWTDTANWYNNVVPTKGAKIEIHQVAEGKSYPKLTDTLDLNTTFDTTPYKGEITVKPGATFDLDEQKVIAGKITNNGLIKLNGNAADQINIGTDGCITVSGSETGANPTIEYTGSGSTTNFVWDDDNNPGNGKQYVNLIMNRTGAEVSNELSVSGNLTISKTTTVAENIQVSGNLTIETAADTTINTDKSISVNKDVTSAANVNGEGKLIFCGTGTQDQVFDAGGKSYTNIVEDKTGTGKLTVNSNLSVGTFTITNGAETIFDGTPTITTLAPDNTTGKITFNTGGSITNQATFLTDSLLTFGNENTDSITFANNITHTNGSTQITGSISAASINLGTTTIPSGANTNITTSGNQEFTGTVSGGGNLILNSTYNSGTGIITFNSNVGGTSPLASLQVSGGVKINSASSTPPLSIKTSGTQIYNSSIDLGSAPSVVIDASAITFKDSISDTDTATSLEVTGPVTINSSNTSLSITTLGDQTYDSTIQFNVPVSLTAQRTSPAAVKDVTLKGDVTGSTGTTLAINANTIISNNIQITAANEIDFSGNINGAGKTLTINTPLFKSTIGAAATAEIALSQLTISQATTVKTANASNLRFNVLQINGNENLTFAENAVEISLVTGILINPNLISDRTVICEGTSFFNGTVDNSGSITANGAVQITGNVSNSGTITCNAAAVFKGDFTNTNGILTGDTTNGSDLVFEKNYSGTGTSELTASKGYTKFQKNVDLSSTTFTHTSGIVNFTGNGTSQTLATQSDGSTNFYDVLITSPATVATTSSFIVSGTSWTSHTDSACFTASSPSAITFNNASAPATAPLTTVSGNNNFYNVICKTENQNITFTSDNIFTNTITLGEVSAIPGTVIINSASLLTFNPDLYCKNLTLNAGTNAVTFSGDSNFISTFTNEASGIMTFTGSTAYGNSFVNSSENDTIIKKSFTGSGNASFAGDLKVTDNNDRSISAGAGNSIITNGNLFIDTNAANIIQLNTNQTSLIRAKNILLYSGKITLNGTLESTQDIILLGPDYATLDPQTGIEGIYLYHQTRPSPVNYTSDFRAAPYDGELTALHNATMKAGKNFYSNGITMQGPASGQWNIQLPKTSISQHGFAEAIKTSVSGSKVSSWEAFDNAATDDTAPAKIAAYECTDNSGNLNWYFEDFVITTAWTERDDAIYVEFNAPVRNRDNEITNALTYLTYKGTAAERTAFTGIYTAPDCQNANIISDTDIELTDGHYRLYLKAPDSWNTDATGKSAGTTAKSSDRNGNHKSSIPYLDIPRSLTAAQAGTSGTANVSYIITNKWGKRLNNYSTRTTTPGKSYGTNEIAGNETVVLDKTGPVLWSVRTGQELHSAYNTATGAASQHSYDSHNFLEFRYSEPVSFGSPDTAVCDVSIPAYSSGSTVNVSENIQVTDRFGAISENITSAAESLTFTGLARLEAPASGNLQLYTGKQGSANKYMNALYRTDEYSVRLSVAGWTDGTVSDYSGNTYKKWAGYIEQATQFTGAQAFPVSTTNALVKDKSGNPQIEYEANKVEPVVRSNSTDGDTSHLLPVSPDVYSTWDLSSPVFTPLRFSAETEWGDLEMSEAIGNTNGSGSTLDRIDFHFFDNTPSYSETDAAEWFTEIGWCVPGSQAAKENLKDYSYTYCADIIGGARQFDTNAARRTTGGIRFSTKSGIAPAFKYSTSPNNPSPSTNFINDTANTHTTIISQLFTGSSAPMRPANDPDGLYLGLGLTDTNLSVETTFAFSYNESQGYLTDLAGNRLRTTLSKTIDRTPPSFDIIFSPVDSKSVYIVFVKKIVTNAARLKLRRNSGDYIDFSDTTFETLMPKCFRIISIDSSGNSIPSNDIQIDTAVPAQIIADNTNDSFTCIKLATTKDITIENLKNLYVQLIMPDAYPSTSIDPFTSNNNSRVTLIQDPIGNYMSMYCAHALSDFAINYINPLYAYSSDMLDAEESVMNGLYKEGSWAVHDWNADQQNYGTLPAEHPVSIVADTKSNTNIRLYLSPSPDADSVSKQFNYDFNTRLRVWLPSLTDGIFRALSANNNTNFIYADGTDMEDTPENLIFNLSKETVSAWQSGTQISFLFGLMDSANNPIRIYNNPYFDIETDRFNLSLSIPVPLYSLRMHDVSDINTLDLWSFKIKGTTGQRGGVTILNNVINASLGEKTIVKVELPQEGKLNVIVMTLDGNVITYLNRGNTRAGEHYFTWNGQNRNGAPVARGMYFIRVTGSGIDETRKVMVVKD